MGFLEDLGKKVADAGQKTVQKTKDMSDVARLDLLAKKEENKLNQVYGRIGKLYADMHGDDFEEEFAGMINEVKEAEQNIRNYRQQIEEVKNGRNDEESGDVDGRKCPNCGAHVCEGSCFCTSCGQPIPQPEEASGAEEEAYCSNCGAKLAADAVFCEECGTKV